MEKLKTYLFLFVLIISLCCYGDVQTEFASGWQKICDGDFEQARGHYNSVISSEASSTDKANANFRLSWVDAFEAIANGQYEQAKSTVDSLKSQYANNESLGVYVFRAAEQMEWDNQLDLAKQLYSDAKTIDESCSSKATWHELWIGIFQLVDMGSIDVAVKTAGEAKEKFTGNADLAEMLFRVGERLRWKAEYDKAKELFAKSIEVSPEGYFAQQSQFETLWIDTLEMLDSRDYDEAEANINRMLSGYSSNANMPKALYSFAERYRWAGFYSKVDDIYKKINSNYANSEEAGKASLDSTIVNTLALISPDNITEAEGAIENLIAGLEGDERLPDAMALAGEQYYLEGCKLENSKQYSQSETYYQKALTLWESLQSKFGDRKLGKGFYSWAGDCYNRVGKFEESIGCYESMGKYYPKDKWHALFMTGRNYESLMQGRSYDKEKAAAEIRKAYEEIMTNYPDCPVIKYVKNWLKRNAA